MVSIHAELTGDASRIIVMASDSSPIEEQALAAKMLETLTPLFSKSDPPGALLTPATWPALIQLSATFGPSFVPGPRLCAWIEDQVHRRTDELELENHPLAGVLQGLVPDGLVPRDYQVAGALEINRTGRCLIFDEPRTGKTMTTILGLALLIYADPKKYLPAVVVCPASVVDPWVEAFQLWAPYLSTTAWRGPKRTEKYGEFDVYVTSYDTARIDAPAGSVSRKKAPLVSLNAQSLVVDESHFIKNPTAARTKSVHRLARRAKGAFVGLSGTPITHHPADLWPALVCLSEAAWPARERWTSRYCHVLTGDYREEILGLSQFTETEFRLAIAGQHRRVARADVMSQLPPKVYSIRTVDLPASWRKVYDDFEADMLAQLPDGEELSSFDALSVLQHCSSLACAAADVRIEYGPDVDKDTGEEKRHVHLDLKAPSWKVDALLEILGERPGESVLAFAPSAQLMRLAGAAAADKGYRVGYVIGDQAPGERTATIRAFQAGDLDLVCVTTKAGGTGITLSRAGTVVFLQRPWSLVEALQAEDRAEGDLEQTRGTEVIDVIARDTIDTRIREVIRARGRQLADLVQDPRIVAQLLGGRDVVEHQAQPELVGAST